MKLRDTGGQKFKRRIQEAFGDEEQVEWDEPSPIEAGLILEAEFVRLWMGAISIERLREMRVGEVLDRLNAGRRIEAERRRFEIEAAMFAQASDRNFRHEVIGRIEGLARSEVRRKSAFELMPDARRIEQIGGLLERFGDAWADAHATQMRWLASRGITRDEAISRHAEWYRRSVVDDPFLAATRKERERRRRDHAP